MTYYVIKGWHTGDTLRLQYWTGKDWVNFCYQGKQYKSRKIAENAISRTVSNTEFDKYRRKEVVEVIDK